MGFTAVIQTTHLLFVGFQETTFDEGSQSREGMALVQEFVAGDIGGEVQEGGERSLLLRGALEHIEGNVEGLLVTELRGQTDISLRLGLIAVLSFQA
jgi:hypothetical protein